jgi:hypothetical protein
MNDGGLKQRPFCQDRILTTAVKCRFYDEWLEPLGSPLCLAVERDALLCN